MSSERFLTVQHAQQELKPVVLWRLTESCRSSQFSEARWWDRIKQMPDKGLDDCESLPRDVGSRRREEGETKTEALLVLVCNQPPAFFGGLTVKCNRNTERCTASDKPEPCLMETWHGSQRRSVWWAGRSKRAPHVEWAAAADDWCRGSCCDHPVRTDSFLFTRRLLASLEHVHREIRDR